MGSFDHKLEDCKCCAENSIDYSGIPSEHFNKWHSFSDMFPEYMVNILATDGLRYAVINLTPAYLDLEDVEPFTHWMYLPLLNK